MDRVARGLLMLRDFRLEVFVTVARELSFTRAAEELCVSQPAVTKHIKELERLLSTPLFRRSGNKITLTAYGEKLLPLARRVLDDYQLLVDGVCDSDSSYVGRLRVGASTTIAQYILPSILAKFRSAYSGVDLSLTSGNSEEMLRAVEQERIDVALVEDGHNSSMFHYEHFADDRVVLVSSKPRVASVGVDTIKELPLVLRESGSGTLDVVERELARHSIHRRDLNVVMKIGSSEGIIRYLRASDSYAFISQAAVKEALARNELYICNIDGVEINRTLRFVTLHGDTMRVVELFKEFCREHSL